MAKMNNNEKVNADLHERLNRNPANQKAENAMIRADLKLANVKINTSVMDLKSITNAINVVFLYT